MAAKPGCNSFCAAGPIMVVYPRGNFLPEISIADVPEIIDEQLYAKWDAAEEGHCRNDYIGPARRGGGGFPTGMKWSFACKAEGDVNISCAMPGTRSGRCVGK